MIAEHYAEAEVLPDGYATVRFVCTGGPTDLCHQWCGEGCEESCYGEPIRRWTGEPEEPIAQAPAAGHRWEPMPPDGSSCRVVDWLDASGDWRDTYDGEDYDAQQVLRPGRHLITEDWDGDNYLWHYAADDVEPAIPGRPM